MQRLLFFVGSLIITQLSFAKNDQLPQPNAKEEQLKAVFILNFTQFIEWPVTNWKSDNEPLVITVLDDKPFSNFLRKVVKGEKKGNHPIVVNDVSHIDDLNATHILYVGRSYSNDVAKVLTHTSQNGMLTVSDVAGFAEQGGVIKFYLENEKMRIQINRSAALARGLQISSKLLSVAQVIENDVN